MERRPCSDAVTLGHKNNTPRTALIRSPPRGPIVVVGDVQMGEYDAIRALLPQLYYDGQGNHSDHQRLVFLGAWQPRPTIEAADYVFIPPLATDDGCNVGTKPPAYIRTIDGGVKTSTIDSAGNRSGLP